MRLHRNGGHLPDADNLARVRAMDKSELVGVGSPFPTVPADVFEAILRNMLTIGARRDKSVCPVCGGPPNPVSETGADRKGFVHCCQLCKDAARQQSNVDGGLRLTEWQRSKAAQLARSRRSHPSNTRNDQPLPK